MWIHLNFDKYDELPFRESRANYLTRVYGNMWNLQKFDYYQSNKGAYCILYRILKSNINKSFDLAFSYYCKKVEKQYQYLFLREFEYKYRYKNYWIDKNKIIRYD